MTKSKLSALKAKLWSEFTLWVKLSNTEDGEYCECISCHVPIKIGSSNCQGGHYLNKKSHPVHYFNEDNVHPQCFRCNHRLEGNSANYRINLIEKIGLERVEWLEDNRHGKFKMDRVDYAEKTEHYKELNKQLQSKF